MQKRNKLEIIRDVLKIIQENHNSIKITPLIRKSNLSSQRFTEYFNEILEKDFIQEISDKKGKKTIKLTEKGFKYIEKFNSIISFIEEFGL
ncbi:MAG: winged helix-turn-helix domain-containing protein [Candidatus Pacearchaeota archaeon]|jgi:predicted transcriptional regulator